MQNNNYNPKSAPYKLSALRIVSYILLFAAVFYVNYLGNRSMIVNIIKDYQINETSVFIVASIIMALVQVGIFELISRLLFNFVSRKNMFKAFNCNKEQFMDVLRWFYIIRCVILGSISLLVLYFNFLLPLFNLVINFIISVIVYFIFFIWLKKLNYLNMALIHRTFLNLAVVVVLYYGLIMFVEFIYF